MARGLILCVDDEKTILDSLKTQLKRHFGNMFLYEFAENALEGLDILEEVKEECQDKGEVLDIILIVSDWLMPGIRGDEFLTQIHKKDPSIIKVLLTGQADNEAIERAKIEANLHKCINKPWSEEELISIIKSIIKV